MSPERLSFALTPDGADVVFLADRAVDGTVQLYVAPLDGSSAPLRLNAPLAEGGNVASQGSRVPFRIRPAGALVAYLADQDEDECYELFLTDIERTRVRAGRAPISLPR